MKLQYHSENYNMFTRRYMYNVVDLHAKMHVWISNCNVKKEAKKYEKKEHKKYTIRTCRDDNIWIMGLMHCMKKLMSVVSFSLAMVVKLNWNSSHKFCTNLCRTKRNILWMRWNKFFPLSYMNGNNFSSFSISEKKRERWDKRKNFMEVN
jgi:hypothetical protein